jgi:hypothetical protein
MVPAAAVSVLVAGSTQNAGVVLLRCVRLGVGVVSHVGLGALPALVKPYMV